MLWHYLDKYIAFAAPIMGPLGFWFGRIISRQSTIKELRQLTQPWSWGKKMLAQFGILIVVEPVCMGIGSSLGPPGILMYYVAFFIIGALWSAFIL